MSSGANLEFPFLVLPNFIDSMPSPTMSDNQLTFFERKGYVRLRAKEHGLVDLAELRKWTDEVLHWPRERKKWLIYDEITEKGQRQIMRTEKITDYHPQLRALLYGDTPLALLKKLTGRVCSSRICREVPTDGLISGAGRAPLQR